MMKKILPLILLLAGCSVVAPEIEEPKPAPAPIVAALVESKVEKLAKSEQLYREANMSFTVGFDFLGIKSPAWNCRAMLAPLMTLPGQVPVGAFIDNTFGTSDACLRALLSSGRVYAFRAHFVWSNHQAVSLATSIHWATYFNQLALAYPDIAFFPSDICEHSMTAAQSAARHAQLQPYLTAPNIKTWVDSGTKFADPAAIRECHGPTNPCTAKSLDGQSAVDIDVERFKQTGTLYSLLWTRAYNCRKKDDDKTPPNRRVDCPTQDQFNLMTRYFYPMPGVPSPQLSGGEISKPEAENYGGCKPNTRDCRPVYILHIKNPSGVRIYAANGSPICWAKYGGPFTVRGLYRYYLGLGCQLSAFPLGQSAEGRAGSETCMVDDRPTPVYFNCYRRQGVYR